VLLRKLADQAELTAGLASTLLRAGKFPLVDRGVGLVSMAAAIVPGATSMNDNALLAYQEPLFGPGPAWTSPLPNRRRLRRRSHPVGTPREARQPPGQDATRLASHGQARQ